MKQYFYKPIKIRGDGDKIHFWGCPHVGHHCAAWDEPLWKKRGFDSVEIQDAAIISRWNACCDFESVVFLLGDAQFYDPDGSRLRHFLCAVNFKELYIMAGNHVSGYKNLIEESDNDGVLYIGGKKVMFIPNYVDLIANGTCIALSHYPVCSWNGQGSMESIMLHSHCHGGLINTEIGKLLYKARILDVGFDCFPLGPVSLNWIVGNFKGWKAKTFDHH